MTMPPCHPNAMDPAGSSVKTVPNSRGRKRKPGKNSRARTVVRRPGRGRYTPGMVAVDERQGILGLARLPSELLVEIGLPVWWLILQSGNPANVCLDGALVLRTAYAQFGITAVPKLVELVVTDPGTDHATAYGTQAPHFVDGEDRFVGHMGLWLPHSCRFIDHSVQQFPQARAETWLPMTMPLSMNGVTNWDQTQGGFAGPRGRLMLTYNPLPEAANTRILSHPYLDRHAEQHHRVGINVASNLLQVLRLEELRERALSTPHTRLHALLELVGDADVRSDGDGNLRFVLPGTEASGGVPLDQINPSSLTT